MNEKLEALNQEIEKTEKKLQRAQHEEKMLEHQIKTLTRKERTHRLCTRAAMLESYLPHPEAITDEQVSVFLKLLFHKDSTRQLTTTPSMRNTRYPRKRWRTSSSPPSSRKRRSIWATPISGAAARRTHPSTAPASFRMSTTTAACIGASAGWARRGCGACAPMSPRKAPVPAT